MFRDNNTFDDNNFLRVTLNTLSTTNEYFKTFQTMKTTWFLYFTDLTYSTFNKIYRFENPEIFIYYLLQFRLLVPINFRTFLRYYTNTYKSPSISHKREKVRREISHSMPD